MENPSPRSRLQKLLFLLNENIRPCIGGTGYKFVPYHYGPFDSSRVHHDDMSQLRMKAWRQLSQLVTRADGSTRLPKQARQKASGYSTTLTPRHKYVRDVCNFVHEQSFASLVSSIYNAYPDMKVNSVLQQMTVLVGVKCKAK